MKHLLLTLLLSAPVAAMAQTAAPAKPAANPVGNIKKFHILFYYSSATPLADKELLKTLQGRHLNYIDSLYKAGQVAMAGPIGDKEMRGILVLQTDNTDVAKLVGEGDPLVKAGHFRYEVKPWYTEPGHALK